MVLGYHTNHSPRKKSGKTLWGTNPSTKSCFSDLCFGRKRVPGPPGTQIQGWGSKNALWGQKCQSCGLKSHAELSGRCPKRSHMLQVMAKFVFGAGPPQIGGVPFPQGDLFASGATPSPQGQPLGPRCLCPGGNSFAPGTPGTRDRDQGSGNRDNDQGPGTRNQGPETRDQGPGTRD